MQIQTEHRALVAKSLIFIILWTMTGVSVADVEKASSGEIFLQLQLKEIKSREALLGRQAQKPESEKSQASSRAYQFYQQGRALFNRGGYASAQSAYEKAISIDASVDSYYYEYAISLYKNNQFKRAQAILAMLESSSIAGDELIYYQALSHYKMNETSLALQKFLEVKESQKLPLSPLSAMYAGVILQKQKKYNLAKENYQFILDTSKDPKLDAVAEKNIEAIISIEQQEEERGKSWNISLISGLIYDENVLNIADNFSTSDLTAYRLMYGATVDYRFLYQERNQWMMRFSASDMYSVDKKFKSNSEIQSVDPLQISLSLPYTHYSNSTVLTVSPSYQQIYMSLDEDGRDLIYSIAGLDADFLVMKSKSWISNYRLEATRDIFHPESTAVNDQTATKMTLSTVQTKLFDTQNRKTLFFDLSYTSNNAKGNNSKYNRPNIGLGGSYPISSSFLSYGKIEYFIMDYNKSETERKDSGFIFTLGSNYDISSKLSWSNSVQYYKNDSSVVGYEYNKFVVMSLLSYQTGFF